MDATLSEAVLLRSIRKFFIDAFATQYSIYFEFVERQPKDSNGDLIDKWLIILPNSRIQDTLASATVQLHLFVDGDSDGIASAEFRDTIVDHLYDFTQTDCKKRMVCYNQSWEPQFTAVIDVLGDSDYSPTADGLGLRIITFRLQWGAK